MNINEEKILYTCESISDVNEYKKMAKYFPKGMYWTFVITGAFWNLLISAIIAIISKSLLHTFIFFAIFQIYLLIYYKVRLEKCCERVFNSRLKKGQIDTHFTTEFYDSCFIRKGETVTLTIKYSDISKVVETNSNIYLEYPRQNLVIILQKNRCDIELLNFIREKTKNIEKQIEKKKEIQNRKFIQGAMNLLFVVTIASFLGASWTQSLLVEIINPHGFNFIKTMWVFWCWLPIPILSIVLGFKYNKIGFQCTKNMVVGFIVGFFLLIFGCLCLVPTFSQDYSKINDYRTILDVKLPENGELEIQNWNTYFDEDKTEYTIIKAYYDKEDTEQLVNSIRNNNNWLLSTEIKSELKVLVPFGLHSDSDAFFSIYNQTTNQYNLLPENEGYYDIYTMSYDISNKQLEIHKFKMWFETENEFQVENINDLRVDYDLGTCRNLSGNVSVVLFYVDDFESSWTRDEISEFTNNEVKPGLQFLEKQAESYGVKLDLTIRGSYRELFYDDEVIISTKQTGLATIDVLEQLAVQSNYSSAEEMFQAFKSKYGTDEVVFLTIFNKDGTSYAINPHRGETQQVTEHCILFVCDLNSEKTKHTGLQSSVIANQILYLYGAENLYRPESRRSLAEKTYPNDVMFSAKYDIKSNNIDDATAFYVGWTDEVPKVFYDKEW